MNQAFRTSSFVASRLHCAHPLFISPIGGHRRRVNYRQHRPALGFGKPISPLGA